MCVRVRNIEFVLFTDCESCTRPISTNPVSMEAGEYGLTRGACFFARRLEVVAVAGLLRLSWCVRACHEFAFSNSLVDREQPISEGAPTAS